MGLVMSDREVFIRVESVELSTHRDGGAAIITRISGVQRLELDKSQFDDLYAAMGAAAVATGRAGYAAG